MIKLRYFKVDGDKYAYFLKQVQHNIAVTGIANIQMQPGDATNYELVLIREDDCYRVIHLINEKLATVPLSCIGPFSMSEFCIWTRCVIAQLIADIEGVEAHYYDWEAANVCDAIHPSGDTQESGDHDQ